MACSRRSATRETVRTMAATSEGAMDEISSMLQRMRELSLQSASDTVSAQDRANLDAEVDDQLVLEIDRITSTTTFQPAKTC